MSYQYQLLKVDKQDRLATDVAAILSFPTDTEAQRDPELNDYHQMCERFRTMDKVTIAQIEADEMDPSSISWRGGSPRSRWRRCGSRTA